MDGELLSSPRSPEPRRPWRKVLDHDAGTLSADERDALLERIDAEIADIDDNGGTTDGAER